MADIPAHLYESAIRTKDRVIRDLIRQNSVLLDRINQLTQLSLDQIQDRAREVESTHEPSAN